MPIDKESPTAIVLEDDCLNVKDLTLSLMGRVKEMASLVNLKKALCIESLNVVKMSLFLKLLDVDNYDESNLHSKRICILSKVCEHIHESFKIVFRGKVL
ncbi:hypothetical protein Tco_0137231 [Tanacetum coccineum]